MIESDECRWQACNNSVNTILMQFTGLKDKNNKEVYEGDIVQFFPYHLCKSKKWKTMAINGQVIFNNNSQFCIRYKDVKDEGEFSDYLFPIECRVIGNIYENPELLKWKKN